MTDDPLGQCLQWLAGKEGRVLTREALTQGLPLRGGQLIPSLLPRAAERAGLKAAVMKQRWQRLNPQLLPCILLLKDNRACILERLEGDQVVVRRPELEMAADRLSSQEMAETYAGVVIYCRPVVKIGETSAEQAASADSGHWFWSVIRRNRRVYRDVLAASLLTNLFALAMPLFVMNVYDRVVPNQSTDTLWVLAAGMGLVICADLILRMLRGWFVELAAGRADNRASARIMERVLGMKLQHLPSSVGAMAGNIQGFESVRAFCGSMVVTALIDLPFFLLFLLIIVLIAPLLGLPVAMGALVLILYALSVQQRMQRLAEVSGQVATRRTSGLIESLACLPLLKSLNATGRMQRRWEQATRFLSGCHGRQRLLGASVSNGAAWVQQSVAVVLIMIGVYLIIDGQLSQGALIAAYMLSSRAMAPVSQTAALLTQYHQAAAALRVLDEVMATPQERAVGKAYISRDRLRGDIELNQVSFAYPGSERAALKQVSLRIKAGEKVAILGATGSGKSTLGKLILGLYEPSEGDLFIDGVHQQQIDPAELRRNIGYVSQEVQLLDGTVYDNVTLGLEAVDTERLQQALRVSGLEAVIGREADGWSLPVGENGRTLSGGQRQTVALARAIMADAPILLLDEPASAMDSMMEQHLCAALKSYCAPRTLLLVTHRTSLLQLVDRLIVLDQGRLIADGPKQHVLDALASGQLKRAAG
jgi:ATP-binding cassette subfamily C protein LapB